MTLRRERVFTVSPGFRSMRPQVDAPNTHVIDMHVAFNYGQATGSAQLLRFITEHTEVNHKFRLTFTIRPDNSIRSFISPHIKIGNVP